MHEDPHSNDAHLEAVEELDRTSPLHRRAFFTSLFGGITAVALIRRFGFDEEAGPQNRERAFAPALQTEATPVASPVATVASPAASPVKRGRGRNWRTLRHSR